LRFILTRSFDAGAPSVVFEVSNELDIADPTPLKWDQNNPTSALLPPLRPWGRWLWWIDPSSYNLYGPQGMAGSYPFQIDMRRVEHGISPVQKIYADIINDIRLNNDPVLQSKYAGKTIDIAGPAFAGTSFQWYPVPNYPGIGPKSVLPTMEEHFLDLTFNQSLDVDPVTHVGQFNAALDRFSFHFYGDFLNGYNPDPLIAPYTTLRFMTNTVRTKLAALNHSGVSLFVSEWGPTTDETSDINYSHKGAAWAAAFLAEAVADHVAMGSYLTASDYVGAPPHGFRRTTPCELRGRSGSSQPDAQVRAELCRDILPKASCQRLPDVRHDDGDAPGRHAAHRNAQSGRVRGKRQPFCQRLGLQLRQQNLQ
jgi:hypothetical protein